MAGEIDAIAKAALGWAQRKADESAGEIQPLPRPTLNASQARKQCPTCSGELKRVPGSHFFNAEQSDSMKAGDWFCETCPDNGRGKSGLCYWWNSEVEPADSIQCEAICLEHTRSCPDYPGNDAECTCGLEWRIKLSTEQTMHAAWRKRAEEAEQQNAELHQALRTNNIDVILASEQTRLNQEVKRLNSVRLGLEQQLAAARAKIKEIVCTGGCDAGVVMLDVNGSTHTEQHNGQPIQVYDHAYFSPLGDALIELYQLAGGVVQE